MSQSAMLSLLGADKPASEYAAGLNLFGQIVGSWEFDVNFIGEETETQTTGEWHFDWILQGRALQDVLIFPALEPSEGIINSDHKAGTSLRFYDAEAGLWRVVWVNPSSGIMYKLTGGAAESEIVLDGDPHDGEPTK